MLRFTRISTGAAARELSQMEFPDFTPKKVPRQARSRATFDAIVEAAARLLAREGYGAITTNRVAEEAGVSIGSLYEYFGDKDVIVHQVLLRLGDDFFDEAARSLVDLAGVPLREAIRAWLGILVTGMRTREPLLRAIFGDVPLIIRESLRAQASERHIALAREAYALAGSSVRRERVGEIVFILVTMVEATLTRLVLDPPEDIDPAIVMDELAERIAEWVAAPAPLPSAW
jgi:AcrR family transcriptional regulator